MKRGSGWLAGNALAAAIVACAPARAADPRDDAYEMAAVEADHDICEFPLSDEQQDVIAQRRDALVTGGDLSPDELASIQEQVTASLRRQRSEGLCRPDGAEARLYKRRLAGLGLP